mgnify:CR=1 FL=1
MSSEIEDHRLFNDSKNEPFSTVLERRVSRRNIMRGGLGAAAATMFAGFGATGCSDDNNVDTDDSGNDSAGGGMNPDTGMDDSDLSAAMALAFRAVAGQNGDRVSVPDGYEMPVQLVPLAMPKDGLPVTISAR